MLCDNRAVNWRRCVFSAGAIGASLVASATPALAADGGVNAASLVSVTVTLDAPASGQATIQIVGLPNTGPYQISPLGADNCIGPTQVGLSYPPATGGTPNVTQTFVVTMASSTGGARSLVVTDLHPGGAGTPLALTSNNYVCPQVGGVVLENDPPQVLGNIAEGTNLPRTGGDIKQPVVVALVLVASGIMLVVATRRQRKAPAGI